MRRATRRYGELYQDVHEVPRERLEIGCWVIYASDVDDLARQSLGLSIVQNGPDYTQVDGHALCEVWHLADGTSHAVHLLTRVEIEAILGEALTLAAAIRRSGSNDDRDATAVRVHRAACLARSCDATKLKYEQRQLLFRLVFADTEVSEAEVEWQNFTTRVIPTLAANLRVAGALALARDPAWVDRPGTNPHPRWSDK